MSNPHLYNPLVFRGSDDSDADGAVVLLHGRRQTIDDIYHCAERIGMSSLLYAMPVADQSTWYPRGFMRPIEDNEPRLSDALAAVDAAVVTLMKRGFLRDRIALMGFSQGACLACEYVYRNPDRWGGLIAFTGGLFGPEDTISRASGSFRGTPVFLGIGDPDEWIPAARVEETADASEQQQPKFRSAPILASGIVSAMRRSLKLARSWRLCQGPKGARRRRNPQRLAREHRDDRGLSLRRRPNPGRPLWRCAVQRACR